MDRVIKVIDLSEWTGDVSLEHAHCMKAQGVEGAIIQAWGSGHIPGRRNEFFHETVDAFREVGIINIDPYVWPPAEWRQATDWIGHYRCFMAGALYLDVEAGAGVDDSIVLGAEQAGWEPRIYASPTSWAEIMGNTTRYSDRKLWLARYLLRFQRPDGYYNPGFDVAFPSGAFGDSVVGGWGIEDLVGWQTTGTVPDFCGESIDSSVFYLSAFGEEEHMPTAEYTELLNQINQEKGRSTVAGLFLEVEAKLAVGVAIPTTTRDQVRWLLGGTTPNTQSTNTLLRVLYSFAAATALSGKTIDEDTRRRLRYAVR